MSLRVFVLWLEILGNQLLIGIFSFIKAGALPARTEDTKNDCHQALLCRCRLFKPSAPSSLSPQSLCCSVFRLKERRAFDEERRQTKRAGTAATLASQRTIPCSQRRSTRRDSILVLLLYLAVFVGVIVVVVVVGGEEEAEGEQEEAEEEQGSDWDGRDDSEPNDDRIFSEEEYKANLKRLGY